MRISDWSSDVCSSDLPVGQRSGVGRRERANGGYLEAVVAISHILQSVALQALGRFLKPPVKFAAPLFEPFAGCAWKTERRHERHRLGFAAVRCDEGRVVKE